MAVFFPEKQDPGQEIEYNGHLKNVIIAQLDQLLGRPVDESKWKSAEDYFYEQIKPKVFDGPEGLEAKQSKAFERACVLISQSISRDPKKMTVLEFYQTLEELQEQSKAHEKAAKRIKRHG